MGTVETPFTVYSKFNHRKYNAYRGCVFLCTGITYIMGTTCP